ncbi:MAG: hypothetical protein MZU95_09305 [Desulfomicrobium escambiense]|nr:hypothetical protein [Desulfomicrobium escambiense]
MPETVPAEAPSTWLFYFGVDDRDTSVDRSTGLGGQVFMPAMDMGLGRFAGADRHCREACSWHGHMVAPEPA